MVRLFVALGFLILPFQVFGNGLSISQMQAVQEMESAFKEIYEEDHQAIFQEIVSALQKTYDEIEVKRATTISEKDVFLLSYGDAVRSPGKKPLRALHSFSKKFLKDIATVFHFLPFYPYTSDRGFGPTDHHSIDPNLGTEEDLKLFMEVFERFTLDYVANHQSSFGVAFEEDPFLADLRKTAPDPDDRLELPRTTPHFHHLRDLAAGADPDSIWQKILRETDYRYVRTTFGNDQVDFNFRNPKALLYQSKVLMKIIELGADWVRVDAAGFMWFCEKAGIAMDHPKVFAILKFFKGIKKFFEPKRKVQSLVEIANNAKVVGEYAKHAKTDYVYNFALAPLVIWSFYKGDASKLLRWIGKYSNSFPKGVIQINTLDNHDGPRPHAAEFNAEERAELEKEFGEKGGTFLMRSVNGNDEVYELNSTWWSAFHHEDDPDNINLYLASRAISIFMKGIPGFYLEGLWGAKNGNRHLLENGHPRDINRNFYDEDELTALLQDPTSRESQVYAGIRELVRIKQSHSAFSPEAESNPISVSKQVFAIERYNPDTKADQGSNRVVVLINVSDDSVTLNLKNHVSGDSIDLISGNGLKIGSIELEPYQIMLVSEEP